MIMRNWNYSLWMLVTYFCVFAAWRAFPSRACFLIVGTVAVLALIAGMIRAAKDGYFVNRVDRSAHALVIIDLVLETIAFEVFRLVRPEAVVEQFHGNLNFFGCSFAFAIIIGVHRWLRLSGLGVGKTASLHQNLVTDSFDSSSR